VRNLPTNGNRKILLNLGNVSYIDSSGIGELVAGFISMANEAAR
jgi:anti-sigma B factor antagonist